MDEEVSKALSVPEVRYSRVWEDHRVLSKALCIQPLDVVLCITSAGDNVLNLLLDEPRKLVAVDMSEAQTALLELKLAAIRSLCYEDFLVLLGEAKDEGGRWDEIYQTVKKSGDMPTHVQQYWDVYHESLKSAGSWFGNFEKFIIAMSRDIVPSLLSSEQVDAFLSAQSLDEQRRLFDEWPTEKLKALYSQLTSSRSQLKGRDKAQLKYIQQSEDEMQEIYWSLLRHTCREIPVRDNFYLGLFLRGQRGYDPLTRPDYCPPYLTREGFSKLKGLIDRVVVYTGALEDYLTLPTSEKPSKVALSNIFEYMSQEAADLLFGKLATHMVSGGRVAFWDLLSPRLPSTEALKQRLCPLEQLSTELYREDRAPWYVAFHVLEVK